MTLLLGILEKLRDTFRDMISIEYIVLHKKLVLIVLMTKFSNQQNLLCKSCPLSSDRKFTIVSRKKETYGKPSQSATNSERKPTRTCALGTTRLSSSALSRLSYSGELSSLNLKRLREDKEDAI